MLNGGMLIFHADGVPVPQGSVSTFGGRHVVAVTPALRTWREIVADAARESYGNHVPLDQPCTIQAIFYLPKPAHPKFPVPGTKPDGDKLLRAIQDALEGIVVTNDSRFVSGTYYKQYAVGDMVPGVNVLVDWNNVNGYPAQRA